MSSGKLELFGSIIRPTIDSQLANELQEVLETEGNQADFFLLLHLV